MKHGASMADALLLRARERLAAATSTSPAVRAPMLALFRAGEDHARAADRLVDAHAASAVLLYGEAALHFAAAAVTARGGASLEPGASPAEILAELRALPSPLPLPESTPGERARAEAFVEAAAARRGEPGLVSAGHVAPEQAAAARAAVRWLSSLVEPRSVAELRFLRRFRVGALALGALTPLIIAAAVLLTPKNVALHKPVTLSAVHPLSVSPPSGLTDGILTGSYGAQTTTSEDPWQQVDLERSYKIDKVKVYNRGDQNFDDGMPMRMQCSEDGQRFVDIETRSASFSQTQPWVAKLRGRSCRYVRIHAARGTYLALTEVEIFGRPK
jgi:hypothetical protein